MPSKKIEDCCKELQEAWPWLRESFQKKFPGWDMRLTCTWRPSVEQFELFKKGREKVNGVWRVVDKTSVVTYMDGYKMQSNHNKYPALAFDVVLVDPKGKFNWDSSIPQWQAMPELCARVGLISGGSWKRLKDFPHVEVGDLV